MSSSPQQEEEQQNDGRENGEEVAKEPGGCPSPTNNDFVIREGFPALRLPGTDGRQPWIEGEEPIPVHPFWAADGLFDFGGEDCLDKLRSDCEIVFSARAKEDGQAYSAGVTYFCPSEMKPRCLLEDIVLRIFRLHTRGLERGVMIPEQSGAEWWTLVLDDDDEKDREEKQKPLSEKKKAADGDGDQEEEEEGDEVGLHFDADYGLEDQAPNLLLHPRLATVTYLTNYGAPTVVFDRRSPPPDDPDKKKLEGDVRRGWLSQPKIGKHVAFDGRLLHGAPATFFPPAQVSATETTNLAAAAAAAAAADEEDGGGGKPSASGTTEEPAAKRAKIGRQHHQNTTTMKRRITLLVNVWVNHCPLDAELLDDDICQQLQPVPANDPLPETTIPDDDDDDDDQNNKDIGGNANDKGAAACKPPFAMKDDVDLKDLPVMEKVKLVASQTDPAGEEEFVLCSRIVTAKYGAAMDDLHGAATAAHGGLVELDLAAGAVSLEVGGVVEDDDDDHDDKDNSDHNEKDGDE